VRDDRLTQTRRADEVDGDGNIADKGDGELGENAQSACDENARR